MQYMLFAVPLAVCEWPDSHALSVQQRLALVAGTGDPRVRRAHLPHGRSDGAPGYSPGGDLRSRECEIVPRPGVMALFPAVQYHYVKPNRASGNRISIAFNVYHPDFRVHYYEGMQQLMRVGAPPRTELGR